MTESVYSNGPNASLPSQVAKGGIESFIAYQEERSARREQAVSTGGNEYSHITTLKASDLERAKELANEVVSLPFSFSLSPKSNRVARLLEKRKNERTINKSLSKGSMHELLNIAQQELQGNVELAYIDMESGLMEPYDGEDLARSMARDIVSGRVTIIPVQEETKNK